MNHPDLDSPRVARAAAQAALRLAALWGLSDAEIAAVLGVNSPDEVREWRRTPPEQLPIVMLVRTSRLLHIHAALQSLFPPEFAAAWLRRVNSAAPFGGRTPLSLMLESDAGLRETDLYLRAAAAGNW